MSLERVPLVNLKKEGDLNVVTISNGVNNSLTNEGLRDMLMALTEALSGNSNPIMITGSGERAFSMGYSASCTKISDKMHLEEAYSLGTSIARIILRNDRPVISAINGYALGLGLEIALCSDFIISSRRSHFGMPEIKFGIPSLTGFVPEIPDKYPGGLFAAVKSGAIFGIQEAQSFGMITAIVDSRNFMRDAENYCRKMETRLVSMLKPAERVGQYRQAIDSLFFRIYSPSCLTMTELERFRNSI